MATTVTITEAKQRFGELADRVLQGEQVLIVRKSKLLTLAVFQIPEPVPMRPPGYFDDCYDTVAAAEEKKLTSRSVTRRIVR